MAKKKKERYRGEEPHIWKGEWADGTKHEQVEGHHCPSITVLQSYLCHWAGKPFEEKPSLAQCIRKEDGVLIVGWTEPEGKITGEWAKETIG